MAIDDIFENNERKRASREEIQSSILCRGSRSVSFPRNRRYHRMFEMNLLASCFFILIASCCSAQISTVKGGILEEANIPLSTLYILGTGNDVFDEALYKAVHENWTLSPIGDIEELSELDLTTPRRMYIGYLDWGLRRSVAIIRGGTDNPHYDLKDDDILAYAPMGTQRNENTIEECAYRIPLVVASLQQVLSLRIKEGRGRVDAGDLTVPKTKATEFLVDKTLLREREIEELMHVFDHDIRILDRSEIVDAIEEKRTGSLLFIPVYGRFLNILVYDLATRECIYFEAKTLPYEKREFARAHLTPLKRFLK